MGDPMLNPISAGLRNPSKRNLKVELSIPPGAPLDDVADQLLAAGMREQAEPPEFLIEHDDDGEADTDDTEAGDEAKPKRSRKKSEG